jgi:carbamoyl-phosphate synthase large subunit
MPRRTDIQSILLIGSGPIVIGQACEFDYSGTQACKALKEEGYRVILANSNPATIMTDPGMADRTFIEPLTVEALGDIIAQERPDALLPTLGGQTALNLSMDLADAGVLSRYNVKLIGAQLGAIKKAEDRHLFKEAMERIGVDLPRSACATSRAEAEQIRRAIGLPVVIRPSRTLGGAGGNIARTMEEFSAFVEWGLNTSPNHEILIEESIVGWKEFELEVMRDGKDNVVIICSIENFDPMGIHTGDSITIAPAQTLTDKEYQTMRDTAIRIIREIGVDTGGSNIQFAVHPKTGRQVAIEMNPRVSRSSALASKATGFPIAKIAAKLAVGYSLDEIANDITRETPACFEPTIDYVVVKVPRFTFEKFPQANDQLTTQMKSVGEVMAIGGTFKEAMQKAIQSLEIKSYGFEEKCDRENLTVSEALGVIRKFLKIPNAQRLWYIGEAFRFGLTTDQIHKLTKIDPWFIEQIRQIITAEQRFQHCVSKTVTIKAEEWRWAKQMGFSDRRLADLLGKSEEEVRTLRLQSGVRAVFRSVDTCAAEFRAYTPYLYSTYELEDETNRTSRKKIVILGSGPNRIGQGIEFDYCCVHAVWALREEGYETIMVNCNPETVSTDYDTSDKLFFEPLTLESVLNIMDREKPDGVIVQFGGQTPLKLAVPLQRAGVKIIGTSPESIDRAEDRDQFKHLLERLGLLQATGGTARTVDQAVAIARRITYPVLVRPSYVLGGRAMELVHEEESLRRYTKEALDASPDHPVLIDKFLKNAIEVDVDAISDGETVIVGGIMEHIERAGIHSGDSACSIPPRSLDRQIQGEIRRQTIALALELGVVGLMNIQFAVKEGKLYVLEVNPRASRTVPFVSKATGVPLAKIAAKVMVGNKLKNLSLAQEVTPSHISVKESVFPFIKFVGVDTLLGPEMKSTGEVMGMADSFGTAFAKAQIAAGTFLPASGRAFLSVGDENREALVFIAKTLTENGFSLVGNRRTAKRFAGSGLTIDVVKDVTEETPNVLNALQEKQIALVIATGDTSHSEHNAYMIRRAALECQIPYFTTIAGAEAAVQAIQALREEPLAYSPLQDYFAAIKEPHSIVKCSEAISCA